MLDEAQPGLLLLLSDMPHTPEDLLAFLQLGELSDLLTWLDTNHYRHSPTLRGTVS